MESLLSRACVFLTIASGFSGDLTPSSGSFNDVSEKAMSWDDALSFCRRKEAVMTSIGYNLSENPHIDSFWTGRFLRISPFIQSLGCYQYSIIQSPNNPEKKQYNLRGNTVGLCHEYCTSSKLFALQSSLCICLDKYPNDKLESPLSCNQTCTANETIEKFKYCGGNNTVSLYKTSRFQENLNTIQDCVLIDCSQGYKLTTIICSTTGYNGLCVYENGSYFDKGFTTSYLGANITRDYPNWIAASKMCREQGRYLYGNFNTNAVSAACNMLDFPHKTVQKWVGIVREQYITSDRGHNTGKTIQAERCNKSHCEFLTFGNFAYAICRKMAESSTINQSLDTSTLSTKSPTEVSSSEGKVMNITVISVPATKEIKGETNADVAVAVPIVIIVLLGCFGIFLVIIIKKRQRKQTTSENEKENMSNAAKISSDFNYSLVNKNKNSTQKKACDQEVNENDAYFVLEPAPDSYELAGIVDKDSENPYTDNEEGTYDHLRKTNSRKQVPEDTYQHAHFVTNGETSDYDITGPVNREDVESTYDHANLNNVNLEADDTYNSLNTVR